jgi:hypothetical protein
MKKQILLLSAGLIAMLMACNFENRATSGDSTSHDTSMSSMSATDPMQDSITQDTMRTGSAQQDSINGRQPKE